MKGVFYYLAVLSSVATACNAHVLSAENKAPKRSQCTATSTLTSSSVQVGDKVVELSTLGCTESARDSPSAAAETCASNPDVCNDICSTACSTASGVLPPDAADCAVIVDAITILNGSVSNSFTVGPGQIQQLTYQTCRYFFMNYLEEASLTYCWTALADTGSAAGSTCFPPTQPNYSQGLCSASDGAWAVGAAHS